MLKIISSLNNPPVPNLLWPGPGSRSVAGWSSPMTIYTRSSLSPSSRLPPGWKLLTARLPNSAKSGKFYLSPEGKRFDNLKSAKSWLKSTMEAFEKSDIIESPRRKSVRKKQNESVKDTNAANNYRINLSEHVRRRRKMMAERNPYRNLLKTTLKRNYKTEVKRAAERRKMKPVLGMLNPRKHLSQALTQVRPRTIVYRLRKNLSKLACTLCDFEAALKSDLNKHIKSVHTISNGNRCLRRREG